MLSPPYTDGMAHATDAKPCEQSAPWPDAAYPAWSSTHVLAGDAGGGDVGGGGDGGIEGAGADGGADGGAYGHRHSRSPPPLTVRHESPGSACV